MSYRTGELLLSMSSSKLGFLGEVSALENLWACGLPQVPAECVTVASVYVTHCIHMLCSFVSA
jgi:hypothetical protein